MCLAAVENAVEGELAACDVGRFEGMMGPGTGIVALFVGPGDGTGCVAALAASWAEGGFQAAGTVVFSVDSALAIRHFSSGVGAEGLLVFLVDGKPLAVMENTQCARSDIAQERVSTLLGAGSVVFLFLGFRVGESRHAQWGQLLFDRR